MNAKFDWFSPVTMFEEADLLPQDNPADFSYFFDTSRRRTCCLAPERFVESLWKNADPSNQVLSLDLSLDETDRGELTPAMDIFSIGYVVNIFSNLLRTFYVYIFITLNHQSLSYDNAACTGSDISTACHPPSLYEGSMTSTQTFMAGKDQEVAPKRDGLIPSSTTSILLASTPPMLPRWSLTDPSGRPLLADCQRSNPSKALKSSKSSYNQFNVILIT